MPVSPGSILALALGVVGLPVAAQTIHLLDLNDSGLASEIGASFSSEPQELGGLVLFAASDDQGEELWATDGTAVGTQREADLEPGPDSSDPAGFLEVDGRIFFAASTTATGRTLWSWTGPGTAEIVPGSPLSPGGLTELGGFVYFTGVDGDLRGLFRTDVTSLFTEAIAPGALDVFELLGPDLTVAGTFLYVVAEPSGGGDLEVWETDGTAVGTSAVTSLACGLPANLRTVGSQVFFTCPSPTQRLLRLDSSSPSGAALVEDFGSSTLSDLTATDEQLFLLAENGGQTRLFVHNIVTGDTDPVPGLAPGAAPAEIVAFDGGVLFSADNGAGRELFWTDGTTLTERDLRPGPDGSEPEQLVAATDLAFFTADVGSAGRELWVTDGTSGGTDLVIDLVSSVGEPDLDLVGESTFGFLFRRVDSEEQLWVTDGTEQGTDRLEFPLAFSSDIRGLLPLADGRIAFWSPERGAELQVTDGSLAGTVSLGGAEFAAEPTLPMVLPNGVTVFLGSEVGGTLQLYSTSGKEGDVALIRQIGSVDLQMRGRTVYDGELFFCVDDGSIGEELWRSDGTFAGTVEVVDLDPAGDGTACGLGGLAVLGDHLFFRGDDGTGDALWRTDGTGPGTLKVADVAPSGLVAYDGFLYFHGDSATHGEELWRSDGTNAGTTHWADLAPGDDDSDPEKFRVASGLLWFDADSEGDGITSELWRSDGTLDGTFLVHDFDSLFIPIKRVGLSGGLVLQDYAENRLLLSDGQVGEPTELGSFDQIVVNGNTSMVTWEGALYFVAETPETGLDLWRTDGTVEGTDVFELEAGAVSSSPSRLLSQGARLWLVAWDDAAKTELHYLEIEAEIFADGFETGETTAWQ